MQTVQYIDQLTQLVSYNTIHITKQFMITITRTCFGTGVPSSGSPRTQSVTSSTRLALVFLRVRRLREDVTPVPKYVRMILIMNRFVICI